MFPRDYDMTMFRPQTKPPCREHNIQIPMARKFSPFHGIWGKSDSLATALTCCRIIQSCSRGRTCEFRKHFGGSPSFTGRIHPYGSRFIDNGTQRQVLGTHERQVLTWRVEDRRADFASSRGTSVQDLTIGRQAMSSWT